MGWSPAPAAATPPTTDAGDLTAGSLASARQSLAVRNKLIAPCRLALVSGSLQILALDGGYIYNPLTDETVAISSISPLAATGLTTNTLHNVYLDTGTGALSCDTTAWTTTGGMRHRTGDAGRLLEGWAYVVTGPAFVDTITQRGVCSLFNPQYTECFQAGANQSSIPTDNTFKTPATDMVVRGIKHPDYPIEYFGQVHLSHDSATQETQAGVDVTAAGTPGLYTSFWRSSGSSAYISLHFGEATSPKSGAASWETSRIRIAGSNAGSTDTMSIINGGNNYLRSKLWC